MKRSLLIVVLAISFGHLVLPYKPVYAQGSGHLVVIDGIQVSPANPKLANAVQFGAMQLGGASSAPPPTSGSEVIVTATFRLRNETGKTVTIRRLQAGARGPNACALGWGGPNVDFPAVENLTLRPGEEVVYRQSRSFSQPGDYFVEPVMQDAQGRWGGIRPFPRTWFNVADAAGNVPPPECLIVRKGVSLSKTSVSVGQEIEASFVLYNNGREPVTIRRLIAAARGPDGPKKGWNAPQADFPALTDIVLSPGQEIVYRQRRTFGRAGTYFVEPAYMSADGKWSGVWPWPRLEYEILAARPADVRPPSPDRYCWNTDGVVQGPSTPPTPFLYQPFRGSLSGDTWTSQMDHDRPNYAQDGRIATLGEQLRFDVSGPGLAGGIETGQLVNKRWVAKWFAPSKSYMEALKQGYTILAYQSPLFEAYLYYDGHDGHDFAVSGDVLAAADGIVAFIGNYGNALGRVIEIYHPQGYLTRYAHLASFAPKLEVGAKVKAGEQIGSIGGSAVVGGQLRDNYWGTHLHFVVFRWHEGRGVWQVTDPFGWAPWAGPDQQRRLDKQREDPLVGCNGEISYNLWVNNWPQPYGAAIVPEPFHPTKDRYVGGWVPVGTSPVAP